MRRLKQEALSTQTTTSDEAPRERLNDVLTDAYERRFERQAERNMFMLDESPTAPTPETVDALLGKVSSPEMAALAAKYVTFDAGALSRDTVAQITSDVRSLAASVLSQAEAK